METLKEVLERVRGLPPDEQVREVCEVTHTVDNIQEQMASTPGLDEWLLAHKAEILRWRNTVTDEDYVRWDAKRKG